MHKAQRKTLAEAFGLDISDPDFDAKLADLITADQEVDDAIRQGDNVIMSISFLLEESEFLISPEINKIRELLK